MATSQGTPQTAGSHQKKPGDQPGTHSPSEPPEGANPAHTLISDFWPPEPSENKFLLF